MAKIITYSRRPHIAFNELLAMRKKYGFKIVIDVDDNLNVPPNHVLYDHFTSRNMWSRFKEMFVQADAMTCTTGRLADNLKAVNDNVFVVPNAMPFTERKCWGSEPVPF